MSEPRDDDLRDVFSELHAPASTASYVSRVARDTTGDAPVRDARRWPAVLASVTAGAVILVGAVVVIGLRGPRSANGTPLTAGAQVAPSARIAPAMTYDSTAGLTVLYGGRQANGACCDTDTWTWDGSSWHDVGSGGPKLADPVMTDDPADGGVLMLGGVSGAPVPLCNSGIGSARATPAGVKSGGAPSTAYCAEPAIPSAGQQTWLWRGGSWQKVAQGGPPVNAVLGTDPGTGQVIAVAVEYASGCPALVVCSNASAPPGYPSRAETWVWGNRAWSQATPFGAPSVYAPNIPSLFGSPQLLPVAREGIALVDGGAVLCAPPESCPAPICPLTASCRTVGVPLYRWQGQGWLIDDNAAEYPPHPASSQVALNGTHAALIGDGSVWTFNGTTWNKSTAPFLPGRRNQAGFAADRNGNYILFGGVGPHGIGNDTWLLTPSGWHLVAGSPATPAPSPPCPTQTICASVVPITVSPATPAAAKSPSVPIG